jgi:glycosyltransferase involved in cell wall biosynthesis
MKVGLVICGDLAFASGGFLYDRRLVDCLRRCGDEVDVISLPWNGYAASLVRGLAPALDPVLRARLQEWQGDILLQDELAHPALLRVNRLLRRKRPIPIVSIVHHLRASEHLGLMEAAAARWAERRYLRSVDAFVFNGEATRRSVERLMGGDARGIVAPPGGDRLGCGVTEEEAAARASEGGALRILFAGSLIPRKGLLVLLRSLAGIPSGDWRLTVAGSRDVDPAYVRRVERFVDDQGLRANVVLAGYLEDAELARQLRTAHLLAVPSVYEGFGIVYLEAMGFGVVPIGSTAGGASEVIEEGTSGFLVRPGDSAALARIICELVGNRSALAALAGGALRRFRQFAGWERRMSEVRGWLLALAEQGA